MTAAAILLRFVLILHSISVLLPVSILCENKKPRKVPPEYYLYPDLEIPSDVQISTKLHKGVSKRFTYISPITDGVVHLTLITCSSPLLWSFGADPPNSNPLTLANNATETTESISLQQSTTMQSIALKETSNRYFVLLKSPEMDTMVHFYLSTEPGGAEMLNPGYFQTLKLTQRQRRKRLMVKWNPSYVDPQFTDYCLVLSTTHPHSTLCSAQIAARPASARPQIHCVGRKTRHTFPYMKQGQTYYIDLFATNHQSNLTYHYGNASTIFKPTIKPITLKENRAAFANLRKYDGKAVFRFKVGRKPVKKLDFIVMPCGGAVEVEIRLKDQLVNAPKRLEDVGTISVKNPVRGGRYYVKIYTTSFEDSKQNSGVEVIIYASSRSSNKIPLPNMPKVLKIEEYKSLRTCNSVTIGWMAAPILRTVHYCLVVKEGDIEGHTVPNQCNVEAQLKRSTDYITTYCKDYTYSMDEQVILHNITRLQPGKYYTIQVVVKKSKGRSLSYNLLQVHTWPKCT